MKAKDDGLDRRTRAAMKPLRDVWFKRPRRLTKRERSILIQALKGDPPRLGIPLKKILAQVPFLRATGREGDRRCAQGVWVLYFHCTDPGPVDCVSIFTGRTASDPTMVGVFATPRGRINQMEVSENHSGRPPHVVNVP